MEKRSIFSQSNENSLVLLIFKERGEMLVMVLDGTFQNTYDSFFSYEIGLFGNVSESSKHKLVITPYISDG